MVNCYLSVSYTHLDVYKRQEYVSVTGDNKEFNKEFFDNENWYIRLLMEAEDRMHIARAKSAPIMVYFLIAMLQMMRRL